MRNLLIFIYLNKGFSRLESISEADESKEETKDPEQIKADIWSEKSEIGKSNGETKRDKFRTRSDVVTKTIFRQIKQHYVDEFKRVFDFTKRRRRSWTNHSEQVYKHSRAYIIKVFGEENIENMVSVFVSLIDSKQKFADPCPEFPNLKTQINSLLRAYNSHKASSLLKIGEFSRLVLKYVENWSYINEFLTTKNITKLKENYYTRWSEIRDLWISNIH